jgi:hypothetical protein
VEAEKALEFVTAAAAAASSGRIHSGKASSSGGRREREREKKERKLVAPGRRWLASPHTVERVWAPIVDGESNWHRQYINKDNKTTFIHRIKQICASGLLCIDME